MKTTRNCFLASLLAFASLFVGQKAEAGTLITVTSMGSAPTAWTNAIWKINPTDAVSNAPVAGNTYVAISNGIAQSGNVNNTRIRNPAVDGTINFPGDSLTLQTNTDIRFKKGAAAGPPFPFLSPTITRFPGVGGNPGLILNGGSLNPGDDATFPIAGSIQVLTDSLFGMGDGNIQAVNGNRGFQVQASLTGTGSLIILNGHTNFACVEVTSASNDSYTGSWIVKAGWLKGTGSNSLGKGDVILDTNYNVVPTGLITAGGAASLTNGPVRFEVNYNIDTPGTLTVANGDAQFVLHQDCRFARVFVDGSQVANGTYSYATIAGLYPNHIVPGGSGSISVGPATPSGLAAVSGDTIANLTWSGSGGATGYIIYSSTTSGGPYTPVFTNGTATTYLATGLVNATTYYFVVTEINSGGESAQSNEAAVTPNAVPPSITIDVVDSTNCTGSTATFSVTAAGAFPLSYQWYTNAGAVFTAVTGQTNSTINVANVQFTTPTNYYVVITNNDGSITSRVASLVVKVATVASTPANQTICPGSPVTFTTTATGAGTLTYTWRKAGTIVQGPDGNNSFTIASVSPGDAATYSVTVIGDCNSVSNNFTLTVVAAPVVTTNPRNITVPIGNGTVFTVGVNSAGTLSYQWKTNGVDVPGATASTFAISNLTLAASGMQISVGVTNCVSGVLSAAATLTVRPVFGISFDFNTPGQWTNAPFNFAPGTVVDWINFGSANNSSGGNPVSMNVVAGGGAQLQTWEVSTGGVGVATGSGALAHTFNNNSDTAALLLPEGFDFSSSGKVLTASIMIKLRNPQTIIANGANTQIGFVTTTNYNNQYQGMSLNDQQGFMSVKLQNRVTASGSYALEVTHKTISGTTALPALQTPVNNPTNNLNTSPNSLAATGTNGWYRLTVQFMNVKGPGLASSNFTVDATLQAMGSDGITPGTVMLGLGGPLLQTNGDIVNQTNLFFALRNAGQQSGLDYWDSIYISTTNGPVYFVAPLSDTAVLEGRRATFKAMVDGSGPYTYQWYKNGTAIPGAGNWRYTTAPLTLSDSGSQYTVSVTSTNNSITNNTVTLTVTADPLQLASVGSVDGGVIGVRFSELVDPVSATTLGNYLVNGVAAIGAQVRPNGSDVLIVPPTTVTGAYTVTVANITTPSGTALTGSLSATGRVEGLTGYDVDATSSGFFMSEMAIISSSTIVGAVRTYPGDNYSFGPGNFELTAGGGDIFSTYDGFHFVYKQITGDFDIKMRVLWQDQFRFSQKCGFNARISLDAFSPNVGLYCDAPSPQLNKSEATARILWGGGGTSWGTNTAALYPNAWIRLRRSGDTFLRYSSTNGVNWLCDGQFSPESGGQKWPDTLYVGVAANDNVGNGTTQYPVHSQADSFDNFTGYPGAVITISQQPVNITIPAGNSFTNAVIASASGVPQNGQAGELSYLWQRSNGAGGFTNMPNAGVTNAYNYTSPSTMWGLDNGAQFRCVVSAPGALSVTSSVVTVTVTDTTAPTLTINGALPNGYSGVFVPTNALNTIVVNYSEFVSAATALNPANYTITNSAGVVIGIASIAFNWTDGDQRQVIITTSSNLPPDTYGLKITGVKDLNGNTLTTITRSFFQSYTPFPPVVMEVYWHLASVTNVLGDTNFGANTLLYTNDYLTHTPQYITYSNVFGWNWAGFTSQGGVADNFGVRMYAFFVPTNTTNYTFWWKADDYGVFAMNTNAANSTDPAGKMGITNGTGNAANQLGANNPNYILSNSFATPLLIAGQKYYVEFTFKETGGGDGGALAVTVGTTNTGASATPPAATTVIGPELLAYPDIANFTPVPKMIVEQYTNLLWSEHSLFPAQEGAVGNGKKSDLVQATNLARYISSQPDLVGYMKFSGFQTNLGQSAQDNYLGKIYGYFVPPTNGNYRFWYRSDDSCQLFMNTNAVNSTDPAGKNFIGEIPLFVSSTVWTSNSIVTGLVGGQRYYLEGIWREGGGGDGMTIAVRGATDPGTPGIVEMIPNSMLEFPTNLLRLGAVNANLAGSNGGIGPKNPTITEGSQVTFYAQGIAGAAPYNYLWLKNGQIVEGVVNSGAAGSGLAPYYRTPPLNYSDNGVVYSLVISNQFSVLTQSSTVTVTLDTTPPTIVSAVGAVEDNFCVVTFSENVDPFTAGQLSNYRINGGVTVLSASYDPVAKNRVSLRTSPQTPGTQYTLTVNGVRDASLAGNAVVNATKTFTAWGFGGLGTLYVEIWTNKLANTSADSMLNDPRYVNNEPDISYYTNNMVVGQDGSIANPSVQAANGGDSGANFYGARITGMFLPPSNGLYRFFVRGDDGTKLFMNTNGSDANGAVVIAQNIGANSGSYYNGQGPNGNNGIVAASFSPPISLTNGTPYFMRAVFSEGTGGDYMRVLFRGIDQNGNDYPALGAPVGYTDAIGGGLFETTGNPDLIKFLIGSQPPAELFLTENDAVDLALVANAVPASLTPYIFYQWQKSTSAGGSTFTNIPGKTTFELTFFAPLADDGFTYRLIASIPGSTLVLPTLLHVTIDTTAPVMLSASSIDGNLVGVAFDEPLDPGTAQEPSNWSVDSYAVNVITATLLPSDPRKIILGLDGPISGDLLVENFGIYDRAASPNFAGYLYATGAVQNVTTQMIGTASGNVAGGYNGLVPSSSFSFTNGGFDVSANGFDIWNTADAFQFTYRQVTGNFDIKVRINKLIGADQWSKAGIMARPSTNSNSRMMFMCATPTTTPIAGQIPNNFFAAQYRDIDGGSPGNVQNTNPPSYPNAWIRMQRSNSVFFGYWSTNGTDWTVLLARDTATNAGGAFPDTLQLGLGTVSHDQTRGLANNAIVEYRDLHFPVGASITQQPAPTPVTIGIHQSVTFSNLIASGANVQYQWRNNGIAISGATNATFILNNAAVADSGFYTVAVFNDGGGQISDPLQLIVTNTLPVAVSDSISATQNTARTFSQTLLTGNDTDLEGDPLSVLAVYSSHIIATNFDAGSLGGATLYGTAHNTNNLGTSASGALVINDSIANSAGSMVINQLTPGAQVLAFTANFNLFIGNGTAEPADGFSFNFANDLPDASTGSRGNEDGIGNGFSFCVDQYRFLPFVGVGSPAGPGASTTANTSGMKLNYGGFVIAGVQCPTWTAASGFVPVSITVTLDGKVTVFVNGTNVFGTVALPGYTPTAGRFGLFARSGGQSEQHIVDDLNISLIEGDTALGGLVSLSGGNITYTPPASVCSGTDSFKYLTSDGQLGGTNEGTVTVSIAPGTPLAIMTCATNRTIVLTNTQNQLPDLTGEVAASGGCGSITVTQSPPAGTLVGAGATVVTLTAVDSNGNTTTCQATLTYVAGTGPTIISSSSTYNGTTFTSSFQTQNGVNYQVQYKDDLNAASWTNLGAVISGDGSVKTFTDPGPLPPIRFYRIQVQ